MKYGICTGMEQAELLARLGFDYIEPSVASMMQKDAGGRKEDLGRMKASGLAAETFNCLFPGDMTLVGEGADPKAIREYLKNAFAMTAAFEAKAVVFGSGRCRRCPEGYPYQKAYREVVEAYRIAGEEAGRYDIDVVIEPLSRTETNMIHTVAEGAQLMAAVNHPHVKLLADYYHMIANHDSLADIVTIGAFGHIHIAAGAGRFYPLTRDGEYYETLIGNLKAIGYDKRISIEGGTKDMETDGAKALALLKEIESRV